MKETVICSYAGCSYPESPCKGICLERDQRAAAIHTEWATPCFKCKSMTCDGRCPPVDHIYVWNENKGITLPCPKGSVVEVLTHGGQRIVALAEDILWGLESPPDAMDVLRWRFASKDKVYQLKAGAIHYGFDLGKDVTPAHDPVNHPSHYTSHPSGVECIEVTEHYNFCVGNAIKYLWRAGLKGSGAQGIEDLKKAAWYIDREIDRLGPNGEGLLQDPVQGQTK